MNMNIQSNLCTQICTQCYSRLSEINPIRDELSSGSIGNSLFENSLHNKQYSMSPSLLNNSSLSDIQRLREDFVNQTTKHHPNAWEDQILQATKACEVWKSEADESNRKVSIGLVHILAANYYCESNKFSVKSVEIPKKTVIFFH